jgi:hypothetical protein
MLLAAAAVLAPATPAAGATWGPPTTIDRPGGGVRVDEPVVLPQGRTAMTTAWVRRNGSANAIVARFASGGRFRQVQVHAARRDIASPTLLQDGPVAVFAWQQRAGLTTDVRARAIVNGSFGLSRT